MNSSERMYVGRQILKGNLSKEEAAEKYGVTLQAINGWLRQARKLAEAESTGNIKAIQKEKVTPKKTLPAPEKAEKVESQPKKEKGGSTWDNLI